MNWAKIDISTTSECVDHVCACLLNIGINGFEIQDSNDFNDLLNKKEINWDYIDDSLLYLKDSETIVTVYLPENSQGVEMLVSLKQELKLLKERNPEFDFGRLEIINTKINEEDWANNWKAYFKPIKIGDKLIVKPSWEQVDDNETRTILEIDPASSFGTGQHNTTKLCLEMIEKHIKKDDKVLDLGCGSGILSIGAILLGAKSSVAVDIEENAVNISKVNAIKNNIPEHLYTAYYGNVIEDDNLCKKIGGDYDFLCANIVADVLIAMKHRFYEFLKVRGKLVVSGIITERSDEVIEEIKSAGFNFVELTDSEGWASATFEKVLKS